MVRGCGVSIPGSPASRIPSPASSNHVIPSPGSSTSGTPSPRSPANEIPGQRSPHQLDTQSRVSHPYSQLYPQAAVTVAPMSNTVVIQQGVHMLGESPASMTCSHCQAQIVTRIDYETGLLTWLIVGVLFLVGLWLCCFIPLCINDCKDVIHYFPNCNRKVGRKNRM